MSEFVHLLQEFLKSLCNRFPQNEHIASCNNTLSTFAMVPMMHGQICDAWKTLVTPYVQEIEDGDREAVCKMFDECHNQLIAGIGAGDIFRDASVDEASKESIMSYIQALTELSLSGGSMIASSIPAPVAPTPQPVAAPTAPTGQGPPKIDFKQAIQSFTTALPEVVKQINEVLKSGDGDNPLGEMIKGFMNPDAAHADLYANIASSMRGSGDDTIMESASAASGLTVEEIQEKLKRLETLEKASAKKKRK